MNDTIDDLWAWFTEFVQRLPDSFPEAAQEELLSALHQIDDRLFYLVSTESRPRELIVTADGNTSAFEIIEQLIDAAPPSPQWQYFALKPPMGFGFTHRDGPISLRVAELWFKPLKSQDAPTELGVLVGFPDADLVLENQSVDTAWTILETALGERSSALDIAHVAVDDLPEDPRAHRFLPLPELPRYIDFHNCRNDA
ncbi:MAG: hypothetical protein NXI04_15090 [Planctomycetaceae bacterium]|nr:hypothetical protein [Planctomycetaceae bacterium]